MIEEITIKYYKCNVVAFIFAAYYIFMPLSKIALQLDRLGMTASTLCAIHCALVPVFLTALPLAGLQFLANEWVEISMIIVSVILGTLSLSISYRKQHKKVLPFFILFAGFALIGIGHFAGIARLEPILIPLGGFTVAAAHLMNWRLNSVCKHVHK